MSEKYITDSNNRTSALVVRSEVDPEKEYKQYKHELRYDFFYSCAYCNLSESEAGGVRFTIDHYEPQKARADLVNQYDNLMWSCDTCNTYKGDRSPPESAREQGYRFFRPVHDVHLDHFELENNKLTHVSNTGFFTIEALDLNRDSLLRLRDIRKRIYECNEMVVSGLALLSRFPIDRLPTNIRGPALRAINSMKEAYSKMSDDIDEMLRERLRSHLLDEDVNAPARATRRKEALQDLEGLHPGTWRAPRKPRAIKDKNSTHR
jgi:hypothetical protein